MCKKTIAIVVVVAVCAIGAFYYIGKNKSIIHWDNASVNTSSHGSSEKQESAKEHKEHKFSNNGTLTISNINGTISVSTHEKNTLILDATKKGDSSDFDKIETKTTISQSSATIAAHYHGNDVRASIDYNVTVPEGTIIQSATNVNGSVHITNTTKSITASTTNGTLTITPQKISNVISLSATNGAINLTVPKGTHATVHAKTAVESISSSFPLTIDKTSPVGRKASGNIGKGGIPITLETTNGTISIN